MRIRTLEDAKTDQDAFIRTICEYPHDLRLRLVYADWLDENDDGTNGFAARAEFVRLNCEIAAALRPGMDIIDSPEFGRQEVLFSDHIMRWRMECAVNLLPHWAKRNHYTGDVCAIWRSGFVEEIRCPLDWWVGGDCECFTNEPDAGCDTCHGTGRTPANGPAVVSRHPVTKVVCSDFQQPTKSNPHLADLHGSPYWYWPYHRQLSDEIMTSDHITRVTSPQIPSREVRRFDYPEAAVEALNRALVDWARKNVGLTPIPWEVSR